ncbi:MORN repeat-containing protein [Pseudoduganella rivuli]|nr:hypothetical protein [Pseudoduganella rivuli]
MLRALPIALIASCFVNSTCAETLSSSEQYIGKPDCRILNPHPVANESVTWSGACKDGYAHGNGTLLWRVKDKDGSSYEGGLLRGRRHGEGVARHSDGTVYRGNFANGNLHGNIRIERENEFAVDAIFERGQITAPVSAGFISGNTYTGNWGDSGPDGHGTMVYATGGSYTGEWQDGQMHGSGTVTYPNGITRAVRFERGLPAGAPIQPEKPRGHHLQDPASMYRFNAIARDSAVPFNKGYLDLSPEHQQIVRSRFAILQSDDAPPYPVKGTAEMFKIISAAHAKLHSEGILSLDVLVDEHGAPQSVAIRRTPDLNIAEFVGKILLLSKYTPARCADQPCAMRFPLSLNLLPPE